MLEIAATCEGCRPVAAAIASNARSSVRTKSWMEQVCELSCDRVLRFHPSPKQRVYHPSATFPSLRRRSFVDVIGFRRKRLNDGGLRSFLTRPDVEADFHTVHLFEGGIAHRIPMEIDFGPVFQRNESIAFAGKQLRDNAPLGRRADIDFMGRPLLANFLQFDCHGIE